MTGSPFASRTVLVVEDEFLIADDVAAALRREGAQVLGPVPNQKEAQRLLELGPPPDAAVLDINLQGAEVFPLADRLMALGVPLLFLSGYDRPVLPERFVGVPLLQKPHEAGGVARSLAALLEGSQSA